MMATARVVTGEGNLRFLDRCSEAKTSFIDVCARGEAEKLLHIARDVVRHVSSFQMRCTYISVRPQQRHP